MQVRLRHGRISQRRLVSQHPTPNNQYFLWAATAYGLVEKDDKDLYRLTEIARKILAPTYDDERREGIIKAIAKPAILGRFYSDYGSSLLPSGEIFRNVLEQKYGVPRPRVDETIALILNNARFAELLEQQSDGKYRLLSGNEAVGITSNEGRELRDELLRCKRPKSMAGLAATRNHRWRIRSKSPCECPVDRDGWGVQEPCQNGRPCQKAIGVC